MFRDLVNVYNIEFSKAFNFQIGVCYDGLKEREIEKEREGERERERERAREKERRRKRCEMMKNCSRMLTNVLS